MVNIIYRCIEDVGILYLKKYSRSCRIRLDINISCALNILYLINTDAITIIRKYSSSNILNIIIL